MKIGNVDFGENSLILAPMAGVTDVGFREVCSLLGADATVSEMLSARAMLANPKKTELLAEDSPAEKIKIGQIFGHEENVMVDALYQPALEKYSIIDINMGCPAPKIVRNGEGSALMKNIPVARRIIEQCVKNSSRPITVKFRLGYDSDRSLEFGRMCEEAGASAITLHGRTALQGYGGTVDYEPIARLKASVHIPVIGNGDVVDSESLKRMRETGVDAVMIGRGAQGRPWIFDELKGTPFTGDKFKIVKRHIQVMRERYDEDFLTLYLRKHLLWYTKDLPNSSEYRLKIATSMSLDKSLAILRKLFKENDQNSN